MVVGVVFLGFAALALVIGIGGGYIIARNLSGLSAFAAMLIWLATPFVVLFVLFSTSADPTLPPDRARDNVIVAFIISSIVIAIPWLIANVIGWVLGRRRPKAAPLAAPVVQVPAQPPADPDLPDWRQYDQPSLTLEDLGALMRQIAARAGIEERLLPHVGPLLGADGEHLERDKFDYIYIGVENGVTVFDHREVIADKTMYQVFGNVAHKLGVERLAGQGVSETDYPAKLAAEQEEILAGIDRRWGRQFALDQALPAAG